MQVVYALDSLSLAAVSLIAANGAIARGLHPLVVRVRGCTRACMGAWVCGCWVHRVHRCTGACRIATLVANPLRPIRWCVSSSSLVVISSSQVCTSGVTICFGGIGRDVLCGRDLAIGAQSYALATGCGATVYVALRELALRGLALPRAARLLLSGAFVLALRFWEFGAPEALLAPMQHPRRHSKW